MAVIAVDAISRLRLNASAPDQLAEFFVRGLGFERKAGGVTLGSCQVDISQATGAPYPDQAPGCSPLFQHFAIVSEDLGAAMEQLSAIEGWTPITEDGPQKLPPRSGSVTAFKFRDPEGHPLELIAFPGREDIGRATLRIDHSAISVADSARSVGFYENLGFTVTGRSLNHGPEQARLDGLAHPRVEVLALAPGRQAHPHVELLAYDRLLPPQGQAAVSDVAATRLVLSLASPAQFPQIRAKWHDQVVASGSSRLLLRDPDGHLLQFEAEPDRP